MTKRSYTLEPQRLKPGRGYELCEPHQASRVVVLEVSMFPARNGRKPYRVSKNVDIFVGAGAVDRARELVGRLTRGTNKPPKQRGIYARSLTSLEYNEAIASGKARLS